jgi:hypothetical protein
VAESTASSRRPLGLWLEPQSDLGTRVPRPWALRQAREAWGQQPLALPRVGEKPGRTTAAAPRCGHGPSVMRQGAVEDREPRVVPEAVRLGGVHARQLAPPQAPASAAAPGKAAEAGAAHGRPGHARWGACRPDAAAARAEEEGRGQGRRGRRPRPWRSHTRRSGIVAERRRTRRARRGRPAKTAPAPPESGSRLVVEVEGRRHPEADHGWTVLATTVRPAEGTAPEILQAYQDQTTTVEPGCRWSKPPAAIAPGWLEKPARMAALAMLTVIGLLVSRSMQRQVRR